MFNSRLRLRNQENQLCKKALLKEIDEKEIKVKKRLEFQGDENRSIEVYREINTNMRLGTPHPETQGLRGNFAHKVKENQNPHKSEATMKATQKRKQKNIHLPTTKSTSENANTEPAKPVINREKCYSNEKTPVTEPVNLYHQSSGQVSSPINPHDQKPLELSTELSTIELVNTTCIQNNLSGTVPGRLSLDCHLAPISEVPTAVVANNPEPKLRREPKVTSGTMLKLVNPATSKKKKLSKKPIAGALQTSLNGPSIFPVVVVLTDVCKTGPVKQKETVAKPDTDKASSEKSTPNLSEDATIPISEPAPIEFGSQGDNTLMGNATPQIHVEKSQRSILGEKLVPTPQLMNMGNPDVDQPIDNTKPETVNLLQSRIKLEEKTDSETIPSNLPNPSPAFGNQTLDPGIPLRKSHQYPVCLVTQLQCIGRHPAKMTIRKKIKRAQVT